MTAPTEPGIYAGTEFGGSLTIVQLGQDGKWRDPAGRDITEAIGNYTPFYRVQVLAAATEQMEEDMAREMSAYFADRGGPYIFPEPPEPVLREFAAFLLNRGYRR